LKFWRKSPDSLCGSVSAGFSGFEAARAGPTELRNTIAAAARRKNALFIDLSCSLERRGYQSPKKRSQARRFGVGEGGCDVSAGEPDSARESCRRALVSLSVSSSLNRV
jgi:hypothetical protein